MVEKSIDVRMHQTGRHHTEGRAASFEKAASGTGILCRARQLEAPVRSPAELYGALKPGRTCEAKSSLKEAFLTRSTATQSPSGRDSCYLKATAVPQDAKHVL